MQPFLPLFLLCASSACAPSGAQAERVDQP